jgi:hypothetical protein
MPASPAVWVATQEGLMTAQSDGETTGREILDWWPSGQGNFVLNIQFGEQIVDPTMPLELQIQLDVI